MITDIAAIDPNSCYSYADYLQWTFEEQLELIKGKIFKMSPAPNRRHQQISGNLFYFIKHYLLSKPCRVFDAPFDVRLPDKKKSSPDNQIFTVVQPDICIICDPAKLDERGFGVVQPRVLERIVDVEKLDKEYKRCHLRLDL